jgi:hypothetical protein
MRDRAAGPADKYFDNLQGEWSSDTIRLTTTPASEASRRPLTFVMKKGSEQEFRAACEKLMKE